MEERLHAFWFLIVGFSTTFIRVLHEIHKNGNVARDKALSRLGIGITVSYFAMQRIPADITVMGFEAFGPAIFMIAFMSVEIVDFVLSKDLHFFINLFMKHEK